jgi:beta-glucosidase
MADFPEGFLWGVSTAAWQIEGSVAADGRGESVWDRFARRGRVNGGETGEPAADHYRRWAEDVALMADLGIGAYRFSVAWPRVQPEGRGKANAAGLDFYDRLVDALAEAGIRPMPCLYHWDLPQALEHRGGWTDRDIAPRFADYACRVAERLGDRVDTWFLLNEPSVHAWAGHLTGEHAPGRTGRRAFLAALHNQNRATAEAIRALRREGDWRLGTALSVVPFGPADDSAAAQEAAETLDAWWNGAFLDPLIHGRYPARIAEMLADPQTGVIEDGDMDRLAVAPDVIGVNHYHRGWARPDRDHPLGATFAPAPPGADPATLTAMGWAVDPSGLAEALRRTAEAAGDRPLIVTETGAAFDDRPDGEGGFRDGRRIDFSGALSGCRGRGDRRGRAAGGRAGLVAARQSGMDLRHPPALRPGPCRLRDRNADAEAQLRLVSPGGAFLK